MIALKNLPRAWGRFSHHPCRWCEITAALLGWRCSLQKKSMSSKNDPFPVWFQRGFLCQSARWRVATWEVRLCRCTGRWKKAPRPWDTLGEGEVEALFAAPATQGKHVLCWLGVATARPTCPRVYVMFLATRISHPEKKPKKKTSQPDWWLRRWPCSYNPP